MRTRRGAHPTAAGRLILRQFFAVREPQVIAAQPESPQAEAVNFPGPAAQSLAARHARIDAAADPLLPRPALRPAHPSVQSARTARPS